MRRWMTSKAVLTLFAAVAFHAQGGWRIELPPVPRPCERTAKAELEAYLPRLARRGAIEIGGRDVAVIHVGDTPRAAKAGLGSKALSDEEWAVRSVGGELVLNGGGERGAFYAVCHFLEDDCGVRWWMDGEEDVPEAERLVLPALDRRGKPHFRCRDIYRTPCSSPRFAARVRMNGNGDAQIPPELGGGVRYGPPALVHTWDRYLPFEEYGKDHPEWYSLWEGRRVGGVTSGQLCLTCPGLAAILAEKVKASIGKGRAEAKAAGRSEPQIYDISMNDSQTYCQCTNCAKEIARYGMSGYQLRFENEVARLAGAANPKTLFSVLAYGCSEGAPSNGVVAADNVVVRLCNTRKNMAASLTDASNALMRKNLEAWSECAKNIFVWEYEIMCHPGTSGFPFPSEYHLVDSYRYYARHGVTGFLIEYEPWAGTDMYELKYYLIRKTLEDPSVDGAALMDDFYRRFYGPAAPGVRAAREILLGAFRRNAVNLGWMPKYDAFGFITGNDLTGMGKAFAAAEKAAAGNAKLLRRVAGAKASYLRLREAIGPHRRHRPEPGVSDRPYWDIPLGGPFALWSRQYGLFKPSPSFGAASGTALKAVAENGESEVLFPILAQGVGRSAKSKDGGSRYLPMAPNQISRARGEGYHWYDFGAIDFSEPIDYVRLTRSWLLHVYLPDAVVRETLGKRCRIKARLKFTGPLYGCTGDENAVFVDRLAICEEEKE